MIFFWCKSYFLPYNKPLSIKYAYHIIIIILCIFICFLKVKEETRNTNRLGELFKENYVFALFKRRKKEKRENKKKIKKKHREKFHNC